MTELRARGGKPAPHLDLTGTEWKLAIVTWLAAVYSASWIALDPGTSGAASSHADPAERTAGPEARIAPAASPRRPAPARPGRIRTRSS